jgi:predicted nucleotidyltransferase
MRWRLCAVSRGKGMLTFDFKEFAELLNSNGVEYLVVGGYALAAYGHPRYTGDLDFWVGSEPANADRVLVALAQFGFGNLGVTKEDLTTPNRVIQLGFPPGRIDLLTSIDGVQFAQCYARRASILIDGVSLDFISLEDFKTNKKAVGRHKDLADLEALEPPKPSKKQD